MLAKHLLGLPAVCLLAASASAQAFNIDINVLPGSEPVSTYGAFTGVEGAWNAAVPGSSGEPLVLLDGTQDPNSTISLSSLAPGVNSVGSLPAADQDLMLDYTGNKSFIETVNITNLDVGDYTMVVYSWAPGAVSIFDVIASGFSQDSAVVSSPLAYPGFVQDESLATVQFTIFNAGDDLSLQVRNEFGSSVISGLQLFPTFGTDQCTVQPPNSQGGVPSIIGTGSASAAANNLVLRAGVLPGALPGATAANPGAIVCFVSNELNLSLDFTCPLQGNNTVTGTRCVGPGSLARVPVIDPVTGLPSPGGVGFIDASGVYTIPVDLNALPSSVSTNAGDTLYFQMVYRDFPDSMCGSNLVRWTNAVEITLQ